MWRHPQSRSEDFLGAKIHCQHALTANSVFGLCKDARVLFKVLTTLSLYCIPIKTSCCITNSKKPHRCYNQLNGDEFINKCKQMLTMSRTLIARYTPANKVENINR